MGKIKDRSFSSDIFPAPDIWFRTEGVPGLKKKIILRGAALLLTGAMLLGGALPVQALSEEDVAAPSAVLMDSGSGKVLFEKNAHEKRACASVTKVMTLLLVMEALDAGKIKLEDEVAASAHAASMGGSDIWLEEGEVMTVDDLIKATVIMSANDAAVVLAEYVAGSEEDFVSQMNQRAQQLGMEDTTFKNCNGLDEEGHLTSAYDVALMSRELITHEKIFDYTQIWMDSLRDGKTQLVNTNKLLKTYDGITGLKTGTTGKAGSCISATAERNGLSLIAVVLGCSTTQERFDSAAKLLDYGFANWASVEIQLPAVGDVSVTGGMQSSVQADLQESGSLSVLVPKGQEAEVKTEIQLPASVKAPVEQGQRLGEIVCTLGEETLAEVPILARSAVEQTDWKKCFWLLLETLCCFA